MKKSNTCSEKNKEIVKEHLDNDSEDEPHNQLKTWRLKKRLVPKNSHESQSAKINLKGQLVTEKTELEKLYLETYVERLKPNPIPEDLEEISELKSLLLNL